MLLRELLGKLTDPDPELEGCNRAPIRSIWWFHQFLIREISHASNVALPIHVGMSRVCEPPEASFATMSFHLSTNCVRNKIGRLKLGSSLSKGGALEGAGGLHAPCWRSRENVASTLSIRRGQRQVSTLSSVVCEHLLRPTPDPYQAKPHPTHDWRRV